jgi:hypothetical protein
MYSTRNQNRFLKIIKFLFHYFRKIKEHRTVNASLSSKALNNRYQIVKIKLITVIISNKVLFFGNTINTNKINFSDANSIRFLIGLVQMIEIQWCHLLNLRCKVTVLIV